MCTYVCVCVQVVGYSLENTLSICSHSSHKLTSTLQAKNGSFSFTQKRRRTTVKLCSWRHFLIQNLRVGRISTADLFSAYFFTPELYNSALFIRSGIAIYTKSHPPPLSQITRGGAGGSNLFLPEAIKKKMPGEKSFIKKILKTSSTKTGQQMK